MPVINADVSLKRGVKFQKTEDKLQINFNRLSIKYRIGRDKEVILNSAKFPNLAGWFFCAHS